MSYAKNELSGELKDNFGNRDWHHLGLFRKKHKNKHWPHAWAIERLDPILYNDGMFTTLKWFCYRLGNLRGDIYIECFCHHKLTEREGSKYNSIWKLGAVGQVTTWCVQKERLKVSLGWQPEWHRCPKPRIQHWEEPVGGKGWWGGILFNDTWRIFLILQTHIVLEADPPKRIRQRIPGLRGTQAQKWSHLTKKLSVVNAENVLVGLMIDSYTGNFYQFDPN